MRTWILAAAVVGWMVAGPLSAMPAGAQAPAGAPAMTVASDDLPMPGVLFDRHIEAIGGHDALHALTNRVHRGKMEVDATGERQIMTIWYEAPNKMRVDLRSPGAGTLLMYYDGVHGWADTGGGRLVPIFGGALFDLAKDADFYGEANYAKRYDALETEQAEDFNGEPAFRVKSELTGGKPEYLYFSQASGLLIGIRTLQATQEGVQNLEVRIKDYREVNGGVKYPLVVEQFKPGIGTTTITFMKVETNVDDMVSFERPAEIDRMIEERRKAREQQGAGG